MWLFLIREAWLFQHASKHSKTKNFELPAEKLPTVSVIFAARDEEKYISQCIQSLLLQNYPHLEIIVVNDRSTDNTPTIIDRLAAQDSRIKPLHIKGLPAGWLGKNHGLYQGAQLATGSHLLFTDADIIFSPNAIHQSLLWMESNELDHLVLSPKFNSRTHFLSVLQAYFALLFLLFTRPSLAGRSKNHYIGAGAFNFVKRTAYDTFGGHEALRLEVIDDVMLGRLVVQSGFRQMALNGEDLIELHWYEDGMDLHRGLKKNAFASIGYSVGALNGYILATIILHVLPYIGLFLAKGWGLAAIATGLILSHTFFMAALYKMKINSLFAILLSPAAIFLCSAHIRSSWSCLRNGSITWRESTYPLKDLKEFRTNSLKGQ